MLPILTPHTARDAACRYDLLEVQRRIKFILDILASKEQIDSFLLEDIALTSGSVNLVPHGLGRAVRGFFAVKLVADTNVWQDATSTADLTRFLPLRIGTTGTASLVVF